MEDLGRVQATYDEALQRAMADLTGTTNLRPNVEVDFSDSEDCQYWYYASDGSSHGHSLIWDVEPESAAVTIADLVQDDALEEMWGSSWPACPGHRHPAQPALHNERASWVCPISKRPIATIGMLAP